MIPGDFQVPRPTRRRALLFSVLGLVGLGGVVALAFVAIFIISAWLGRPVVFGFNEGPDQPIAFPHTTHVRDLGLDCTFCHRNVTEGAAATIPSAGLCMTCHKTFGDDLPEVEKLRTMVESGTPIDWVRVHRVPDHVQFVHEAHVRRFAGQKTVVETITNPADQILLVDAAKIDAGAAVGQTVDVAEAQVCTICHGNVAEMQKVRQVRPLKMGDCVDCHRDNGAPTDCTTCHF